MGLANLSPAKVAGPPRRPLLVARLLPYRFPPIATSAPSEGGHAHSPRLYTRRRTNRLPRKSVPTISPVTLAFRRKSNAAASVRSSQLPWRAPDRVLRCDTNGPLPIRSIAPDRVRIRCPLSPLRPAGSASLRPLPTKVITKKGLALGVASYFQPLSDISSADSSASRLIWSSAFRAASASFARTTMLISVGT